jgi:endonuclease G
MKNNKTKFAFSISLLFIIFLSACTETMPVECADLPTDTISNNTININVAAGIPIPIFNKSKKSSNVDDYKKSVSSDTTIFIIDRPQYVVSYSKELNSANWVAWHLERSDYGAAPRFSGNFITDTTLPATFPIIKHSDYTNSGYDRGHLVRSEDRTNNVDDNKATFYLTNIIPQTPDLNRKVWLQLENHIKYLVEKEHKQLFVVAGGVYYSGKKIKDKIAIPDSCWKVVLILDSNQTINDITNKNQTIAVMMPNEDNLIGKKWTDYLTTVSAVENSTQYDFFINISASIQKEIEAKKYVIIIDDKKKSTKKIKK